MKIEKPLPSNTDAEKAVLGACILRSDVLYELADVLTPEDFYLDKHKALYKAMLELLDDEGAFDLVVLTEKLKADGKLGKLGGVPYLAELIDATPSARNAIYYARVIKEKSNLRRLVKIFHKSLDRALNESGKPSEIALEVENGFFDFITPSGSARVEKIGSFYDEFIEKLGDVSISGEEDVISTGYRSLDRFMYGLASSDFIVVAARPGMGKTQFFLNLMRHISIKEGIPVLFFSIEMSKYQIFERFAGILTDTPLYAIKQGKIRDFSEIEKQMEVLREAPLYIDDTPRLSIFDLRLKAKRFVAQAGVKAVFIDHMQLITGGKGNRYHQITEFSGALKGLAKELGIPVVLASQLSRSVEQRERKEPVLSDLRESGAIEQDADKVIFLHREDYYKKGEQPSIVDLNVNLAKNRNGEVGSIVLTFDKRTGVMTEPFNQGKSPENNPFL